MFAITLSLVLTCASVLVKNAALEDNTCGKLPRDGNDHGCTCTWTEHFGISAKCRLSSTLELSSFVRNPIDVVHL